MSFGAMWSAVPWVVSGLLYLAIVVGACVIAGAGKVDRGRRSK
jgi:hypothetical protein